MTAPLRWPYPTALVLVVVAAVAVPVVRHELRARDEAAVQRVTEVARVLLDPPGLTLFRDGCALRGPGTVRCATTSADTRALAARAQQALTRAAGRPASLTCDAVTRPAEVAALSVFSCWTQVLDGGHVVSVTMHTLIDRTSGRPRVTGSDYVVHAG